MYFLGYSPIFFVRCLPEIFKKVVIPAQAGIQKFMQRKQELDSRLRGNDERCSPRAISNQANFIPLVPTPSLGCGLSSLMARESVKNPRY
jgi:hypothetical protein